MKADRIYRADFGSYAVWVAVLSTPLAAVAFALAKLGWSQFRDAGMIQGFAVSLAFPAIAVIWLARYRLIFTSTELGYRSWHGAWSVPYSEIAGISASRIAPISKVPIGAYVHLKNGDKLLVHVKVFSLAAVTELFELTAAA